MLGFSQILALVLSLYLTKHNKIIKYKLSVYLKCKTVNCEIKLINEKYQVYI